MIRQYVDPSGRDITRELMDIVIERCLPTRGGEQALRKTDAVFTMANGLYGYNLEPVAKRLYPVLTPWRNKIARDPVAQIVGQAAEWKVIRSITGSGIPSMGWVRRGQRSGTMSTDSYPVSVSYASLGDESSVEFEAQHSAQGFDDLYALSTLQVMQSLFIKQEHAYVGGNRNLALGTPSAPVLTGSATGGTIPDDTYLVSVVALTYEGVHAASLGSGVIQTQTITGADGKTYVLNGGSSNKSSATSVVLAGANVNSLKGYTTPVRGALGYAWYIGTSGNQKLEAITKLNSFAITSLAGTGQALTVITADCSRNQDYAFDGLLTWALDPSSGAYYKSLATGVEGVGTSLTSDGKGGINEINEANLYLWNNYRLGVDEIWMSASTYEHARSTVLKSDSSQTVYRAVQTTDVSPGLDGGIPLRSLSNPYTIEGGYQAAIRIHPYFPQGLIYGWCFSLPDSYQASGVGAIASVKPRREIYMQEWPLQTRQKEFGVYAEEVLAVKVPFAAFVIDNIGGTAQV